VPTSAGVEFFTRLARNGVKIAVLTNSLESTDVPVVHSGYAKWRRTLLEAGIALFEIKRTFSAPPTAGRGSIGASASSLHAKTLGFVIDSPAMAQATADAFETIVLSRAYHLRLAASGAQCTQTASSATSRWSCASR